VHTIRVHDLAETPDAYIVDVREAHEYAYGHLPGALNVPMSQLPLRYQELPMGTTIYLVCEVGARSGQATTALDAAGWEVVNVLGGTQAWINAGYPLENR
jgi:rhodanese-related sulfurtransferase